MKVLVAAAGAVGQWLGVRLADAGHEITLLTRPAHAEAARRGLAVHGHTQARRSLAAVADVAKAAGPFGAVVVTSKAHQTAAVAQNVAHLVASDGVLLSLQNGFGNAQKLLRFVPAERAAVALTSHGITVEAPGRLHHAGTGPTFIGPAAADSESGARLASGLLADAGLAPHWQSDMRPFVWRKALVNAGINPVGALHGVRNGAIARQPPLFELAKALVAEGAALAAKARIAVPDGDPVRTLEATLSGTADNKCSMLQDVEARRPTETEQILGRMVRLGERLLVSMPRCDAVYGRIKDLEASYLGHDAANRLAWDELAWEREPF